MRGEAHLRLDGLRQPLQQHEDTVADVRQARARAQQLQPKRRVERVRRLQAQAGEQQNTGSSPRALPPTPGQAARPHSQAYTLKNAALRGCVGVNVITSLE